MTTPKPLSPAAQAALEAATAAFWDHESMAPFDPDVIAAATLRAAAPFMQFMQDHKKLLAIATELEGSNA